MKRPTIRDVSIRAGVSIATVNRILSGHKNVSEKTREQVRLAAREIGFYGLSSLAPPYERVRASYRFGILLLQAHRPFYRSLAEIFREESRCIATANIELIIEHLEDISPQNTGKRLEELGQQCDALTVVCASHPLITQAIQANEARGVPVFALIAPLSSLGQNHYIGIDNWKAGRTAAWACHHICKRNGSIGIIIGSPRYRNQELNEAGFRSYLREYAPDFTLIEPRSTFETTMVSHEITEQLLHDHQDLVAVYIAGGPTGAITESIRAAGRGHDLVVIGSELTDTVKKALLDGIVTLSITHPLRKTVRETLSGMLAAMQAREACTPFPTYTKIVPFNICTTENL